MLSTNRCNSPTYLCGPSKYPISREAVWAQKGKLPKLRRTYRHGTVFAPRKYLYQQEATGIERPEMYSASQSNNPTYLCGPSSTPSRGRWYRAQNVKLTKLGRTYCHGTVFASNRYLYQKEATCIERPEMYSASRCNNQNTLSRGSRFGPRTESCLNWDGPIAMVPCLHPGNINTKRKLRAWRDQKCYPLIGTIAPLTCAGCQNTPSRGRRFGPRTESCLNWDGPIAMVPCLHQGNICTKRKLRAWRDQKCILLVSAITPLTCAGRQVPRLEGGGIGPRT